MARIGIEVLSENEIQTIHQGSIKILGETGIMVHHEEVLALLDGAGAQVDHIHKIARLPGKLVTESMERAGKRYVLYGRDSERIARFGYGDLVLMSSPGQFAWIDLQTGRRRTATIQDTHDAIRLADALDNINIVGAMAQPEEVSENTVMFS